MVCYCQSSNIHLPYMIIYRGQQLLVASRCYNYMLHVTRCVCASGKLMYIRDVQEFIRSNPMQSQPLMQAILQTPSLTSLLAPNFSPNSSPPDLFVPMYDDLVRVPSVHGIEVAFTLLSKVFIQQQITDI